MGKIEVSIANLFKIDGYPGNDLYIERTDHHRLESRCKMQLDVGHLFAHGGARNGKTSLVKHILLDRNPINILCTNKDTIGSLYSQIYDMIGVHDEEVGTEGGFSLFGLTLGGSKVVKKSYPQEANSVIKKMLEKDRKYVILDNVHYLERETIKDLAIAIRAFSDKGIRFVMIGVRVKENEFFQFNPDLKGRLEYIEVKAMSREIINKLLRKLLRAVNVNTNDACINTIINKVEREPYKVVKAVQIICHEFGLENRPKKSVKLAQEQLKKILQGYKFA
jgi:hypothetical protein